MQEDLEKWSSGKRALSEGYPIPQWRHGVKWFVSSSPKQAYKGVRGDPPFNVGKVGWCEKVGENYLIADYHGNQVIIMTPDYEVTEIYGEFGGNDLDRPECVQKIPDKKQYLVSDTWNNRILKVDEAGNVLQTLSSAGGNSFGKVRARTNYFYNQDQGEERLFVADRDNHWVVETNWAGDLLSSFGVYGEAGSDASHLNQPHHAEPWHSSNGIFIADKRNDRLLNWDQGSGITNQYVVPNVESVHSLPKRKSSWGYLAVGAQPDGGIDHTKPAYTFIFERMDSSRWTAPPLDGGIVAVTEDLTLLMERHGFEFEFDIRTMFETNQRGRYQPLNTAFFKDKTINANTSTREYPFYNDFHDDTMIRAVSDQSATLKLFTLESYRDIHAKNLPFTWYEYDSVSLSAGTPEHYTISEAIPVMAARIDMGGTQGTASMYISQK